MEASVCLVFVHFFYYTRIDPTAKHDESQANRQQQELILVTFSFYHSKYLTTVKTR